MQWQPKLPMQIVLVVDFYMCLTVATQKDFWEVVRENKLLIAKLKSRACSFGSDAEQRR